MFNMDIDASLNCTFFKMHGGLNEKAVEAERESCIHKMLAFAVFAGVCAVWVFERATVCHVFLTWSCRWAVSGWLEKKGL